MRKLNNGPDSTRTVYQYKHICVRLFHLSISYPIYSCFLLFIIYLQIMDIILYFQIRKRGLLDSDLIINNYTNSNLFNQKISQTSNNDEHIFGSLPIKKIMVGPITNYFHSPLAECMESKLSFTYYFPYISANSISFLHCFLSLISIKFFSNESLCRRQIGVLIFEFRSFLDCLDGVVFRAHRKIQRYKSYYGGLGYYIDSVSDVLGGVCLVIGCLLYFLKHQPLRIVTRQINQSFSTRINSSNDNENEEKNLMILNLESEPKVLINNEVIETKRCIIISLSLFAIRYALSAMFWDKSVRDYENLLDSYKNKSQEQALQLTILHSPLTILIFYLWRYLSAISIQDFLLCSIFFDRTWEFIRKTNLIGWIALLLTIILTQLHADQIRSLFSIL